MAAADPQGEASSRDDARSEPEGADVQATAEADRETDTQERGARAWWGTWIVIAVAVAVIGGYLLLAWWASGRVAEGTTVLGTDLSGMDRLEAEAALGSTAADLEATAFDLTSADATTTLLPSESGLAIDVETTVDGLLGYSLNPLDILRAFTGSDQDVEPVTAVDDATLTDAVESAAAPLEVESRDATVELSGAGATTSPAVDGVAVDVEATAASVAEQWPTDAVEATVTVEPAALSTADADAFADQVNAGLLAGDVVLTGPNGEATVTAAQVRAHGSITAESGEFALVIDGEALAAELEKGDPGLVNEPKPASFSFDSAHQLHTVESQPGRSIDGAALGDAVTAAAGTPERTGELPYVETEADVNNDTLGVTDFKEKVSSFTTPLPYDPIRTKNLARAGELISGTVVMPGEQFDITEVLAPVNAANGYFSAGVIVNGIHTEGYGGGLSQVATTTYNAGYFAGMKDIAHRPHSVWFERYPAGRESTMFIGSINMVFENTTPYALVMSAYVHGSSFTVDIWSTPHFEVKTYASEKTNIVPISTVEIDDPECEPYPGGEPGFTITNTREIYLEGELVDTESYTWTYKPDNAVTCK